jgi:hypothetical protein
MKMRPSEGQEETKLYQEKVKEVKGGQEEVRRKLKEVKTGVKV